MIRYRYNEQVRPPAPFVHVTIRCQETGKALNDIAAQLDLAADRTVIPASAVRALGLHPLDEVTVSGFGGQMLVVPTYRLEVGIRDLPAAAMEVLAHPEEPYVLLGRDVLNRHRILLDGPGLAMKIE